MTGQEAIAYIHSTSWLGSKPGLSRTRELLDRLGHPECHLTFIHVVGTNGKGSVSAFCAQMLRAAGYKTGLYTSPYLTRFHERIQIDGEPIPDKSLARIITGIRPHAESMIDHPTEFELVTAAALLYYYRSGCQFVVLEAGMGGRLDSTNAIPSPAVVAVTRIGLDHTEHLGDTPALIAVEKADVIKRGCEVVLYPQEDEVTEVFARRCAAEQVPLTIADAAQLDALEDTLAGQVFRYKDFPRLSIRLLGAHQRFNAALAVEAMLALRRQGFSVPDDAILSGLSQTAWPGRFEVLHQAPWFVLDCGHNPQCAQVCADALRHYFPGKRVVFLLGVLRDKDYHDLISRLAPLATHFVTVTPDSPRALSAQELADVLSTRALPCTACRTIEEGVMKAFQLAGTDRVICALGSLYMAGRVRACFSAAPGYDSI
ncbi:MAG: bifunctional folylpolyglutamate synthase/dihydrofolate synthase [Oscillospiraceae bacterium]|nr:bifunctional folylpolyglutamate synthase/dihydrofolate synthase [Oscillospiraceae bacterium]